MMKSIFNFLERIKNTEVSFRGLVIGFCGIVFVRILLENFSSVPLSGVITSDIPTIVHYALFYTGTVLLLLLLRRIFIPDFEGGERLVLFVALFLWVTPIFDLIVSRGGGYFMTYPAASSLQALIKNFFGFLTLVPISGVTPGHRLQALFAFFGICFYIIYETRSVLKAVLASILSYVAIFSWMEMPSILKIVHDFFAPAVNFQSVTQFFAGSFSPSLIAQNFLHPTIILQPMRSFEIFFDAAMSQVYYLLIILLFLVYIYLRQKQKLIALFKNARLEQFPLYYLALGMGFFVAWITTHPTAVFSWLNIVSLVVLCIAYFCARMYAVGVNDLADMRVDEVSNPRRALVRGELSPDDMKNANFFFLIWAVLGGFLAGHYVLFMVVAALAMSYIYSVPPLRLKRFPLLGTFIMSLALLSVVFSGFYTLSSDKSIRAFPLSYALLITVGATLSFNMKDIKDGDAEGDRRDGVYTIPALFGERKGRKIVGVMLAASFLLAPLILALKILWIPSVISGILAYVLANRSPYKEWPLALLYFLYVVAAAAAVSGFV